MHRWEEMVEMSNPDQWTPHSVERATRLFISADRDVARNFVENVLLPRFRDEVQEHQKVNVHIYKAMEKALYRPEAFFVGLVFPLVLSKTCTVKEAKVISSVMKRSKIPVIPAAAALEQMCEIAAEEASATTELGSASSMFIRTLIEKRLALPYQVVDSLVFYFLRTRSTNPAAVTRGASREDIEAAGLRNKLPLMWHEAFQIFSELYKNDITEEQRELLLDLLQSHGHPKHAQATRKELLAGRNRGLPVATRTIPMDGDDTMMVDTYL